MMIVSKKVELHMLCPIDTWAFRKYLFSNLADFKSCRLISGSFNNQHFLSFSKKNLLERREC